MGELNIQLVFASTLILTEVYYVVIDSTSG